MALNDKMLFMQELTSSLKGDVSDDILTKIGNVVMDNLNLYDLERTEPETAFVDYVSFFLDAKLTEGKSPKTIDMYKYILTRFVKSLTIPVDKVSIYTLRAFMTDLQNSGLSDKSRRNYRNVLSSFYRWLNAENLMKFNPCSNLGNIKCRKEVKLPFNNCELERIRECAMDIRDKAIVDLLISTGCRISEVVNLDIKDIDFHNMQVRVLGKGNKERMVYLSEISAMNLKRYLDDRNDNKEALFIGRGTDRMTASGIRKMLKCIESKSGVENVHPHRFRRTLATTLINRGMSIQEVATLLGHDNINTTMTYIYIDNRSVKSSYTKSI